MLQENSFKAQLSLFSVDSYSNQTSRFGTTVVENDNLLLRGTDTLDDEIPLSKTSKTDSPIPLSNKLKRSKGYGTGYIIWKEAIVIRGPKEYHYNQPWFFWEEWTGGHCQMRSKYIPKKLRDRIIGMNSEKLPVDEILKVLY